MSESAPPDRNQYRELLQTLKQKVTASQHRAAMSVNSHLIYLYWQIGGHILYEQERQGWGSKIIEQLAADLSAELPEMKGLSSRNMIYMRQFANEWQPRLITQQAAAQLGEGGKVEFTQQPVAQLYDTENEGVDIGQQPAAQFEMAFDLFKQHPVAKIPWSHHTVLMDKLETADERLFYCRKIIEGGWSRKVLLNQLERNLHKAQGALTHNFPATLPQAQSELARDTFKDPYFFDFLQLGEAAKEKDVEDKLTAQITQFLLELGAGFAYMGRQYKMEVGGQEYFLDLLFYHTKLRCYVVIELKIGEFKPEYAGKVQFYLSALDDLVKSPDDQPSIGLILCKEANRIVAEYTLRDTSKPMGVAEYNLVDALPDQLKDQLPTKRQLEKSLSKKNKDQS
ncbi:MAG: DUF1016 domain-containing protein [Cryomorphaceae bacterium]|nr:MAG: DUF1016 domain-containing protein [Cryomorphaceae bacterium]